MHRLACERTEGNRPLVSDGKGDGAECVFRGNLGKTALGSHGCFSGQFLGGRAD